jgi:TolB-like protein/DNA-binding winged helix-turn-helix (wHTH) protein/Tfp pilus assembly protein PilF
MQNGFSGITPKPLSQSDFLIEDWLIQPSLNLIVCGSTISHLEPKAMQVLVFLAEHQGEVLSKDTLLKSVWPDTFVSEQVLTNAIWQIRQGFGEKNKAFIQTVPKNGYRLNAAVLPNWSEFQVGYERALFEIEQPKPEPELPEKPQPSPEKEPPAWKRKLFVFSTTAVMAVLAGAAVFHTFVRVPTAKNTTIAVLPFKNASGDPQEEYLSDGMTEELIQQIGNLQPQQLGVIARTSAMSYKNSSKRIDEIGRELNADYILDGSLRRDGNKVRVTANLVDVKSQRQLWGQTYVQDGKDILLLQSDIAASIANQIDLRLTPQQKAKLASPREANPAARDEYLRGIYLMGKFDKEGVEGAIEHFKRAVELDPQYAQAHVGLADAYFVLGQPLRFVAGVPPMENLAKSKAEATIATQLDNNLAGAHSLLGIAKLYHDWDWKGAESEFQKALELDANSTSAHLYYALFLTCSGRHQQAAPHIRRALELDPLRLPLVTLAGELYADARNYDAAFAQVQKVLELDSNFEYALNVKTGLLMYTGRGAEALDFIEQEMKRRNATAEELSQLRAAFSKSGMRGLYQVMVERIAGNPDPLKEIPRALYYARLGDADKAMESLEKAYAMHDGALLFLRVHPAFAGMQGDPRFEDLARRVGIPKG